MTGFCSGCAHWLPKDDEERVGVCLLISETARLGVKGRREPYSFSSKFASITVNGQRYRDSELVTTEDFGCVHWGSKHE